MAVDVVNTDDEFGGIVLADTFCTVVDSDVVKIVDEFVGIDELSGDVVMTVVHNTVTLGQTRLVRRPRTTLSISLKSDTWK
jgi:hypothetical protein